MMISDRPRDPHGGYPNDATLVIYEDNDDETFDDPSQGYICIYDTRQHTYWSIPGNDVIDNRDTWGEIVTNAFYDEGDKQMLGEPTNGHPFEDLNRDISEYSILAWVTASMGKFHRAEISLWPRFHINMPVSADAIGRGFLAGIIGYATLEERYTPWHICYNWEEDAGFHRVDCTER